MPVPLARWFVALCKGLQVALLALVALSMAGCRGHLAGLHDAVVRLTTTDRVLGKDELESRIARRLAAADIAADIAVGPAGDVEVRVAESHAAEAKAALLWRGGLALARLDPHTGSGVVGTPIVEIDTGEVVVDGPRVVVTLSSANERGLLQALGVAPSARGPEPGGSARFAVMRDDVVLVAVDDPGNLIHDHRLVVSLGTSIVAYTRATDLTRLLATPRLPPLTLTSIEPLPADWLLAAANVLLPFAVSFAWLFFVRRFDRAQPEPMWLVVLTFALGAVAVIPAGLVEWALDALSPWANPTYLTFGRSMHAFPIAFIGFILTVGLTEEGAKLLATWSVAVQRREFDEPVDGVVYAAAAALGFAAGENLRYLAIGRVAGPLVASRAFMSVPAHLFFSTIWGYALGRQLVQPKRRVWPLFVGAITLHGLFDTCLSIDGAGWWAIPVTLIVASIFIVHLQRSLRYGAIGPTSVAHEARGSAELFRMGSQSVFLGFAGAMYLFAALLFVITLIGHGGRVQIGNVVASTTVFALLGWAARGVASSLPLDAVVDDVGVTFAGAEILYRDVLRIERRRVAGSPRQQEQLIVLGGSRELILGPASRATIDALSHALATRLSSVALRP